MKRSHRISATSFLLSVLATGCVVPGAEEVPTDKASSALLCADGPATKFYRDDDGDGYGVSTGTLFCDDPGVGWSDVGGDCNDHDATVHPNAPEVVGDGKDSNCDGKDPDGVGPVTNTYRVVSVRVFRFCDSDGTRCSSVTREHVQQAIDSANSYLYRSESKLRFKLSTSTAVVTQGVVSAAPFGTINSDSWNNECKPVSNLYEYGDIDSKGAVCPTPASDATFDADLDKFQKAVEAAGDVPVFGRGGTEDIKKIGTTWYPSAFTHGYSGCGGHAVVMTSDWSAGTFMAHELGHYLCLPHTMPEEKVWPLSVSEASAEIAQYVADSNLAYTDDTKVLQGVYDPDRRMTNYTGSFSYIQNYPITDTPPDPGVDLFKSVNGDACSPTKSSVTVPTMFTDATGKWISHDYTMTPDRSLIMSYFKCFPAYQHYTPQEVARMEAVASPAGHRANVAQTVTAAGFNNTLNVAIPPRPSLGAGPLQWATSAIPATGSGSPTRVRVHVDITHPSSVNLKLVAPNGTQLTLSTPTDNPGRVKGIFYVNGSRLPKSGTWTLAVAAQYGDPSGVSGRIDDWRIEFE